ncbi:FirrV-1-A32 [Feldmannia irregularis virus a]|uniref:FirrV-1-A32 n=1 Tax=Feldmannia irregularis virus a TaxID=231992 RepID=Q6XM55_9PHYC|nr:FirrV-1-A32 [Feldmannia irregularis virus a]AAR26856.1 FirrV-1-A32 [Feldmannia irregularis virus a]
MVVSIRTDTAMDTLIPGWLFGKKQIENSKRRKLRRQQPVSKVLNQNYMVAQEIADLLPMDDRVNMVRSNLIKKGQTCLPEGRVWRDNPFPDGSCQFGTRKDRCCEIENLAFLRGVVKVYDSRDWPFDTYPRFENLSRWVRQFDSTPDSQHKLEITENDDGLLLLKLAYDFRSLDLQIHVNLNSQQRVEEILTLIRYIPSRFNVHGNIGLSKLQKLTAPSVFYSPSFALHGHIINDLPPENDFSTELARFFNACAIKYTHTLGFPLEFQSMATAIGILVDVFGWVKIKDNPMNLILEKSSVPERPRDKLRLDFTNTHGRYYVKIRMARE